MCEFFHSSRLVIFVSTIPVHRITTARMEMTVINVAMFIPLINIWNEDGDLRLLLLLSSLAILISSTPKKKAKQLLPNVQDHQSSDPLYYHLCSNPHPTELGYLDQLRRLEQSQLVDRIAQVVLRRFLFPCLFS